MAIRRGEIIVVVAAVVEEVSRAPPRTSVSLGSLSVSFFFPCSFSHTHTLSVSFYLSLSLSIFLSPSLSDRRGGLPPRGRRGNDDAWKFNREKRSVSRRAQCLTGRAWTISRKVRKQPGEEAPRPLSLSLSLSLSVCRVSCILRLFLSPVLGLAAAMPQRRRAERTKRARITSRTDIFFPRGLSPPSLSLYLFLSLFPPGASGASCAAQRVRAHLKPGGE